MECPVGRNHQAMSRLLLLLTDGEEITPLSMITLTAVVLRLQPQANLLLNYVVCKNGRRKVYASSRSTLRDDARHLPLLASHTSIHKQSLRAGGGEDCVFSSGQILSTSSTGCRREIVVTFLSSQSLSQ